MRRNLAFLFLVVAGWIPLNAQNPLAIFAKPSGNSTIVGQIVLYDPYIHESTATDDFILRTNDTRIPYVRITYRPMWGFDAPPASPDEILDRKAFNGDGSFWSFQLFIPANNSEESGGCNSSVWQFEERKNGTIGPSHISRFIPVPGTNIKDIPPIATMPCYVLRHKGWSLLIPPEPAPKDKAPDANPGQLHITN